MPEGARPYQYSAGNGESVESLLFFTLDDAAELSIWKNKSSDQIITFENQLHFKSQFSCNTYCNSSTSNYKKQTQREGTVS